MTIKFVVTCVAWKPAGGLKMIYEYANRLASDGHDVHVYYSIKCLRWQDFKERLKKVARYAYFRMGISYYGCRSWFKLHPSVKEHFSWALTPRVVGTADIYIATTLDSAYFLESFKKIPSAKKWYFIQDFEKFGIGITEQMVYDSYKFPFRKIVVAKWLQQKVAEVNEESTLVLNGFDFNHFKITQPIEKRDPFSVIMLYSLEERKGCKDSFAALESIKAKHPELRVNMFGISPQPENLPSWYHYVREPSKQELLDLYNDSAIYVGASPSEGFGLTVGESMACGCAVACTNNAGYLEMAKDGQTALVSPIKFPELLADNILKLMEDGELRQRIARQGNEFIQSFGIEDAYLLFKKTLTSR